MKKIILDLCGGTGSWSQPYKDAGYDVRIITLPDWDLREWQSGSDQWHEIRELMRNGQIYGILAAPPCTMFSIARSTGGKRDFYGAIELVNACLGIIQLSIIGAYEVGKYSSFKFWALENPKGYLDKFIGRPAYSFQPWEYGDPHFKNTHLWGYFNEPKKNPCEMPEKFDRVAWASPVAPAEYKHLNLKRSDIRAITPKGFARAFFRANR